jgi:ABC-type dipeptide/oligopeptide/nickel transport system permease component
MALPLGILAAVYRNTWIDTLATGISLIGQAMPVYWLGLLASCSSPCSGGFCPPWAEDPSRR